MLDEWFGGSTPAHLNRGWTELLVRQLLQLPQRPALVWLTAAWISSDASPGYSSADARHREVLRYYDVPQVSVLALLAPETLDELPMNADAREWAQAFYFNDMVHPGQSNLASMRYY